jgi:hypothetical protein
LRSGGSRYQFPQSPIPEWLPKVQGRSIFQEYYVLVQDDGTVRGAYILKHQLYLVRGETISVGFCRLPISEGSVNPAYTIVGAQIMRDAARREPLLYAFGIGSMDDPFARILRGMRWKLTLAPFYFQVIHAKTFLRKIAYLRNTSSRRFLLDLFAFSGGGGAFFGAAQGLLKMPYVFGKRPSLEVVSEFGAWADALWEDSRHAYSMVAVRDAETLNILYPDTKPFHRLLMREKGEIIGWAVALATQMKGHRQFGDMHVGSIVDCLAMPGHERAVIRSCTEYLKGCDVDLIVSNQNHEAWRAAMRSAGFLRGVSNAVLGFSVELEKLLLPLEREIRRVHILRADGDGPINL